MARGEKLGAIRVTKPKSILLKPVTLNLSSLLKTVSKGVAHAATAQWEKLGSDAVDAFAALGIAKDPADIAFTLVKRAVARAIVELVRELSSVAARQKSSGDLEDDVRFLVESSDFHVGAEFFRRPSDIPLVPSIQALLATWLTEVVNSESAARAIANRFPSFFVYAINDEWRSNAKYYAPLVDHLDTPFTRATETERAWNEYSSLLSKRVNESIFEEPFGLEQLYVPLNAYYTTEVVTRDSRLRYRTAVDLEAELDDWVHRGESHDAIRVLSGGPGSGKSSFARIFAARLAREGDLRVLFVPLHVIDASKHLVEEVGRFVKDEGILSGNPLDSESAPHRLLVIFDGLDELASQGKAAAETARAFVREVERLVATRNSIGTRVQVLLSGREVVVQDNESEFRSPRQVLTLLPYRLSLMADAESRPALLDDRSVQIVMDGEARYLESPLLQVDLREEWWQRYGSLTGRNYSGMPEELKRVDLQEITAQPLLNYLVALSFTRDKIDFRKDVNLNIIYADLVGAVYERGYEKQRSYGPIKHMKLEEFSRVLEEVGLAAWHGDGRTTTVREIEEHCVSSGVDRLLSAFREGASSGVTRLLAAFFFRQHGQRTSGDPTFVFTHKSFGEYLAAKRIVRAVERVASEVARRDDNPDTGWDEREALTHWQKLCGAAPISSYLHKFVVGEVALRPPHELAEWQRVLSRLFGHTLRVGIVLPQTANMSSNELIHRVRNAEEALLVLLNACAVSTRELSRISWPDPTSIGAWLRRVQGQRVSPAKPLAADCLSYLDLTGVAFDVSDLYEANLSHSRLVGASMHYSCLISANLEGCDLSEAICTGAVFTGANLARAKLHSARLEHANFSRSNLSNADLGKAAAPFARFDNADLTGAIVEEMECEETSFEGANIISSRIPKPRRSRRRFRAADLPNAKVKAD